MPNLKPRVRRWLKDQKPKRSQRWLADRLGITEGYLSLILDGKREPSLTIATELESITGIPAKAFVPPAEVGAS